MGSWARPGHIAPGPGGGATQRGLIVAACGKNRMPRVFIAQAVLIGAQWRKGANKKRPPKKSCACPDALLGARQNLVTNPRRQRLRSAAAATCRLRADGAGWPSPAILRRQHGRSTLRLVGRLSRATARLASLCPARADSGQRARLVRIVAPNGRPRRARFRPPSLRVFARPSESLRVTPFHSESFPDRAQ